MCNIEKYAVTFVWRQLSFSVCRHSGLSVCRHINCQHLCKTITKDLNANFVDIWVHSNLWVQLTKDFWVHQSVDLWVHLSVSIWIHLSSGILLHLNAYLNKSVGKTTISSQLTYYHLLAYLQSNWKSIINFPQARLRSPLTSNHKLNNFINQFQCIYLQTKVQSTKYKWV